MHSSRRQFLKGLIASSIAVSSATAQIQPRQGSNIWSVGTIKPDELPHFVTAYNETIQHGRHILKNPPLMTLEKATEAIRQNPLTVAVRKQGNPIAFVTVPRHYLPGDTRRPPEAVEAVPDATVYISTVAVKFSDTNLADRIRAVQLGGLAAIRRVKRMGYRKIEGDGATGNPLLSLIRQTLNKGKRIGVREIGTWGEDDKYVSVTKMLLDVDVCDEVGRETVPDHPGDPDAVRDIG